MRFRLARQLTKEARSWRVRSKRLLGGEFRTQLAFREAERIQRAQTSYLKKILNKGSFQIRLAETPRRFPTHASTDLFVRKAFATNGFAFATYRLEDSFQQVIVVTRHPCEP